MRKLLLLLIGSVVIVGGVAAFFMLPLFDSNEPAPASDDKQPKLVVLVVFDQMRGDYLQKWQPLFGEGGFKRLQSDGAWFTNCHYPYAYTLTAADALKLISVRATSSAPLYTSIVKVSPGIDYSIRNTPLR